MPGVLVLELEFVTEPGDVEGLVVDQHPFPGQCGGEFVEHVAEGGGVADIVVGQAVHVGS
jgi:hypothetical protein